MIKNVVEELYKREILTQAINAIIDCNYQSLPKNHLRRGEIQKEILEILNIQKNNTLCALINMCMKAKGYPPIINRGDQYYRNITRKRK